MKTYACTLLFLLWTICAAAQLADKDMVSFIPSQNQSVQLFWKDDQGRIIGSLGRLNQYLNSRNQHLLFAMNAGMYTEDQSPLGLFIQQGKTIKALNTAKGKGNFYLQPNGIFFILTDGRYGICTTQDFNRKIPLRYATQSGPMLISKGVLNPLFQPASANTNIRNGVGILPDGRVLFAMSRQPVNFYDFAQYFKSKGCKDALYLDGFISRCYYPEANWLQTDGNFGVMIGVTR